MVIHQVLRVGGALSLCGFVGCSEPLADPSAERPRFELARADGPAAAGLLAWSSLRSLPTEGGGVRAAAAAWDGSRLYVVAGNAGIATLTGANRIYTPATNRWSVGAPLPIARDFAFAASLEDGIHVLGGVGASGWLADHSVYSRAANTWTARAPLPIPVDAAVAVTVRGKLYVIGGATGPATPTGAVQIFDRMTNSWSAGQVMPTPRFSAAAGVIDGRIYVAGGQTTGIGTSDALERYDPATNGWTTLAVMPAPREALGGGVRHGSFCVFGGRVANPSPTGNAFPDTFCYAPQSGSWTAGPPIITPRAEIAAATTSVAIFAVGGRTPSAFAVATNEVLRSVP